MGAVPARRGPCRQLRRAARRPAASSTARALQSETAWRTVRDLGAGVGCTRTRLGSSLNPPGSTATRPSGCRPQEPPLARDASRAALPAWLPRVGLRQHSATATAGSRIAESRAALEACRVAAMRRQSWGAVGLRLARSRARTRSCGASGSPIARYSARSPPICSSSFQQRVPVREGRSQAAAGSLKQRVGRT